MKNNKTNPIVAIFAVALIGLFSIVGQAAPPANDNFVNAEVLTGNHVLITRSNVDATKESGEPNHAGNPGGNSIWFKWTAPSNKIITISTILSSTDYDTPNTLLGVYTGASLNTLTMIASIDDTGFSNVKSFLQFRPIAGMTYYIAVDSKQINGLTVPATIRLNVGPAVSRGSADFNRDGITDFTVFRPVSGTWYSHRSMAHPVVANYTEQFGLAEDVPIPADYNGDGLTDLGIFRPSTGTFYTRISGSLNPYSTVQWGLPGDRPVPADYTGNGWADRAVFRPSDGTWYIYGDNGSNIITQQFGLAGDIPVPGDYDDDSKADIAVFRPSNGTWYILGSESGFRAEKWGISGDRPLVGDYDGDGVTDLTVFRPSNGTWYSKRSSNGLLNAAKFGLSSDTPIAGDFDGDGKFDFAVYRDSQSDFYVLRTADGSALSMSWGLVGDVPATNVRTF